MPPGTDDSERKIGILALQGGVEEHRRHLQRLGLSPVLVREERDLARLAGLIIPGGESTCISRLMRIFGLDRAIGDAFAAGMKVWGTCAGAILLAQQLEGEKPCLALVDMKVKRNSFGSQLDSFTAEALVPAVSPLPLPLTFIRAPKILSLGSGVRPLLEMEGYIAAAEAEKALVTIFHPELTGCVAWHRYFARKCGLNPRPDSVLPDRDPDWEATSWAQNNQLGRFAGGNEA